MYGIALDHKGILRGVGVCIRMKKRTLKNLTGNVKIMGVLFFLFAISVQRISPGLQSGTSSAEDRQAGGKGTSMEG